MDASLKPLCDQIKAHDPAVTDSMLESMTMMWSSLGDKRWLLHSWIEEQKNDAYENCRNTITELIGE